LGCLFVIQSGADDNGSLHANDARTALTNVVAASLVSRRSAGVVASGSTATLATAGLLCRAYSTARL